MKLQAALEDFRLLKLYRKTKNYAQERTTSQSSPVIKFTHHQAANSSSRNLQLLTIAQHISAHVVRILDRDDGGVIFLSKTPQCVVMLHHMDGAGAGGLRGGRGLRFFGCLWRRCVRNRG